MLEGSCERVADFDRWAQWFPKSICKFWKATRICFPMLWWRVWEKTGNLIIQICPRFNHHQKYCHGHVYQFLHFLFGHILHGWGQPQGPEVSRIIFFLLKASLASWMLTVTCSNVGCQSDVCVSQFSFIQYSSECLFVLQWSLKFQRWFLKAKFVQLWYIDIRINSLVGYRRMFSIYFRCHEDSTKR